MKQQRFLSFVILAFLSVMVFSCKKSTNTIGLTIPRDAMFAFYADGKSLNTKLPWDSIKNNAAINELLRDSSLSAVAKAAIENPESTGIDINTDFLFFIKSDSSGGYAALEGNLKDAAKFKSFISAAYPGITHAEKDGVHFYSKDQITASYKENRFIIAGELPEFNKRNKAFNYAENDTAAKPMHVSKMDLNALVASLYTIKNKESLGTDSRFTAVTQLKGDIHFWFNGEAFMSSNIGTMAAVMPMLNLSKLYNGNASGAAVNFDDGKITAQTLSFAGKEVEDLWKKYKGSNVNEDLLNRIQSNDITGFITLNFKPKGLEELIKLTGVDGLINMGLAEAGINLDDFIKANGGDVLFAATDFKKDTSGRQDANFVFAVSIGDKVSFKKLIDAGKKTGGMGASSRVAYNSNDKYFAIGNNKPYIDKFIAGGKTDMPFLGKISGNPMGGYISLQKIIGSMQSGNYLDSLEREGLILAKKYWDYALMNGGKMNGHAMEGYFEVNFVDKKTNSLKQLNQFMVAAYNLEKLRKEKLDAQYGPVTDVIITPVPPLDTTEVAIPPAPSSK